MTEGQYENFGTANGTDPSDRATDTDPSHYFGASSAIDIEKSTNGADADLPPGPFIPVTDQNGDPTLITWTYLVTNTGNARLTGLEVTDDHAGVRSPARATASPRGARRPAPRPPTPSSANTPTSGR